MKKTVKTLALLFVSSLVMMSCGGAEADADEACELKCEIAELEKKGADASQEDIDKVTKDMNAIIEKYSKDDVSAEDKKAFEEAWEKCDCAE
jgi:hypothetical protein